MKVKKYPQSHLVITSDSGKKLIIDPGYLTFEKGFKVEDFQGADVYLITHIHDDHLDPKTIKEVVGNSPVYGNADVVEKLKDLGVNCTQVNDKQKFSVAGFEITPVALPHFVTPTNGWNVPPNTGFVVDGVFFHAGDGFKLKGLSVKNAALPYGHPSLSTMNVLEFAKALDARVLIPIHFDVWLRNTSELIEVAKRMKLDLEVRPLKIGEETTI